MGSAYLDVDIHLFTTLPKFPILYMVEGKISRKK